MPQSILELWREELRLVPEAEFDRERRARLDQYLDRGHGSCFLSNPEAAEIVDNALLYYDGKRYSLHAWCIMPNHVHTVFTMNTGWNLSQISRSWKSYTSNECNRVLGRKGEFWQTESFDRYVRNNAHFSRVVSYIENNPVKAGLCDRSEEWRWSSARLHEIVATPD